MSCTMYCMFFSEEKLDTDFPLHYTGLSVIGWCEFTPPLVLQGHCVQMYFQPVMQLGSSASSGCCFTFDEVMLMMMGLKLSPTTVESPPVCVSLASHVIGWKISNQNLVKLQGPHYQPEVNLQHVPKTSNI